MTMWICSVQGDYINPDADPEVVVADLEGVLQHLNELQAACETYKEYQRLFELEPDEFANLMQVEKEANAKYQVWSHMQFIWFHTP